MPDSPTPHPVSDGLPAVSPDVIEADCGDRFDNIVPSYGYTETPMVGIGGSAGSLEALKAFLSAVPEHPGVVFVVIVHLSPDHTSILADILGKHSRMTTLQAADGMRAEPNHVYVIPPGKHLTAIDGHLRLSDIEHERGRRVAVDLFFRTLADSHGPHAAAVVLSGADGDGMIGIKRIKERGGLTIAQDPNEAEIDSMPRMAISTGMVDWVLPAASMPARIIEYVNRERQLQVPPEDGPPLPTRRPSEDSEVAFREILVFLRTRTGRDFSYYKRATILRRIARRMQVNGVLDMAGYLGFLRLHQGECGALLKDLLISVTNFFRDREAFEAVEALIPQLFHGKTHSDSVRVWCPACATGEEAYSFAMMLIEHARTLEWSPRIQVFGCDLDEEAVQSARAGLYPDAITADVSEERLRRFFVKEHLGYRIRREVREAVLFASHDLLKDAPFSRLDLISCRNLLIYLNRDAQRRALDIFHFALKEGGLLFLGSSESVEDGAAPFGVLDKKHRLYRRLAVNRSPAIPLPSGPGTYMVRQIEQAVTAAARASQPVVLPPAGFTQSAAVEIKGGRWGMDSEIDRNSWSGIHFRLLERIGPPSVLIDAEYEIRHVSESASRFLQIGSGIPTTNLLRLVRPELRVELRTLLLRAAQTGVATEASQLPLQIEGHEVRVAISVSPASELTGGLMVVSFRLQPSTEHSPVLATTSRGQSDVALQHLEREIEQLKQQLRDTIEQYEASAEEQKASNEELQAMNEELRCATEELETSREELQSINEELTAVNLESKNKVDELGQANSDLHNLMSSTAIATLFLDRDMRVMLFTPSAAPIFNLIRSDIGRPLSHLQQQIRYGQLQADAQKVLQTLAPIEREVSGPDDTTYLARLLPYRTVEDRIAGVVLTFIDITERQRAAAALLAQNEQLERFNQATIGRELRMLELKQEVNELLKTAGEGPRYAIDAPGTRDGIP